MSNNSRLITDNDINNVKNYLTTLQNTLCNRFEKIDNAGASFIQDPWQYANGGGGISRILEGSAVIEKGGINFSHIKGTHLPSSATARNPNLKGASFEVLGVSVVIHPLNPFAPATHANIRFFIASPADSNPIWWFGGGYDLTPFYPFKEDCLHWHQTAFDACKPFGDNVYLKYKKWCDDYFYLKHRQETRGVGGLFFDDLNQWSFEQCFNFMQAVGNSFPEAYLPILEKRKNHSWGEKEKDFQRYRRGRYTEYNLVYDRGTLFGLQSGGRIESILMSLPPQANWRYNWQPEPDSAEAKIYDYLQPRDWIS